MNAATTRFGWLCALFFLSGISGLMYQVVWLRMLTRILGSTTYATATVLGVFMAGLALGSFLAGRFVDRIQRPLRFYALLELGIALAATATLGMPERLLPFYQRVYDFAGGDRVWLTAGQVMSALVVLLVPTALMGATLPTLCAYGMRRGRDFGRLVAYLYSLNTLGALCGVLASGFILIGVYGETATLALGAMLNLFVAIGAWLGSRSNAADAPDAPQATVPDDSSMPTRSAGDGRRRAVLFTLAVSGFAALGSEVVWSRMLLVYQGTSIYAFSSMLAVVLGGIGIGSLIGATGFVRGEYPLRRLARVQLGIVAANVAALYLFKHLPIGMALPPLILLTPLGILWGLAFPAAVACLDDAAKRAGRSVGDAYAWNTVGCIAGSLGTGFALVPLVGCSRAVAILAGLSIAAALSLLWVDRQRGTRRFGGELLAAAACVPLLSFAGDPYYEVLYSEMLDRYPSGIEVYSYTDEAAATTTAFGALGAPAINKQLWVNGSGVTHLTSTAKLMAHLPLALADEPRDVLVLCMGMGTSLRSACAHAGARVRVVELVPAVTRAFGYFHADAARILQRPDVEVVVDDGRNDLLMHPRKLYDVITLDPPPPLYAAGTVNLYSRDFLELCRSRLRPRGVLCVFIQPDSRSENVMLFQTFLDVFEHVHVWTGPGEDRGFLMIGTHESLDMRGVPAKIRKLYDDPVVAADLREWGEGLDRPEQILDLYVSNCAGLRAACDGAPIVTDDRPFTEFPLWRMLRSDGEYHTKINATPYRLQPQATDPYR